MQNDYKQAVENQGKTMRRVRRSRSPERQQRSERVRVMKWAVVAVSAVLLCTAALLVYRAQQANAGVPTIMDGRLSGTVR